MEYAHSPEGYGLNEYCRILGQASLIWQMTVDLFHNNISPSGKQPKHHKIAHEL